MNDRILVTYASKTGSTGGGAEAIAEVLAADGTRADALPIALPPKASPAKRLN